MALTLSPTIAHEGREVGDYELVFGWRVEPAIVGVLNGPELTINIHEEGEEQGEDEEDHDEPADVEASLQVEVTFGPASRTIDLRPAFGETGHYVADMIPPVPAIIHSAYLGRLAISKSTKHSPPPMAVLVASNRLPISNFLKLIQQSRS
jgi:hypothetical protein